MRNNLFYALALSGLAAASLQAQPVFQDGVLTDPTGKTLYIFDKDQPGISNCSGACLQAWPAYTAGTGAAKLPDVSRLPGDGAQQWTWNKMPLYYFVGDAKPGDRAGDGSGGVWHLVKGSAPAVATPGYSY